MKEIKISLAVVALSAAAMGMVEPSSSTDRFAVEVIGSLKYSSIDHFETLFPSLDQYHAMMEKNRAFYGQHLEAAKQEFADEYNHRIAPAWLESYKNLQAASQQAGIDWSQVSLLRVHVDEGTAFEPRQMTIFFLSNGEVRRLIIDKAVMLGGKWKVGGKIRLV